MNDKKHTRKRKTSVKVGNISAVSGNVNIAGGDIKTNQTTADLTAAEIGQLFEKLYSAIDADQKVSSSNKENIKMEVGEIQSIVTEAVRNNGKVENTFLSHRFRNIARMAPDVLDVVVATLGNPLAGLGIAVRKIADKAKEQTTKE